MGDEYLSIPQRIRRCLGYILWGTMLAPVCLLTLVLRAWIWLASSLVEMNSHGARSYYRDYCRSETVRQLDVAGIDVKKPYLSFLGVKSSFLKDKLTR